MDETVSAAEANRAFSRLLRGVREGRSYVVTAHGRPVARLVPATGASQDEERVRAAALRALIERVQQQPSIDIGRWTRDELYER
jgi:prevent-host-death family protein